MKKFGVTVLTAFLGGALALSAYKVIESKYAGNMSLDEKQKVYFANNPLPSANLSSAGEVDLTVAAAEVTPAVVATIPSSRQKGRSCRASSAPPVSPRATRI